MAEEVTVAFIARQLERVLNRLDTMDAQMTALTGMVQRLDGIVGGLNTELAEKRLTMERIQVIIDDDGAVTATIVDSDGRRDVLEMPFDVADALQAKLRAQLDAFKNRRGWR
jgi:hypothetical protein